MGLCHALTGKCSGCSWCRHSHSRFPSGTFGTIQQPSALSLPFRSTDTADFFHVLQPKLSSEPEGLFHRHIATADTKTEHPEKLSFLCETMNGFLYCQNHREITTCCCTALLWLLTDPVNLPAWLLLWKMWALPAFPRVSNDAGKAAMTICCTVKTLLTKHC